MARDPFEVSLSAARRTEFVTDLVNELQDAIDARHVLDEKTKYWRRLYEQDRTRLKGTVPWADPADLTSYLGTEKVDAILARLSQNLSAEPIWLVEGWAGAQERAAQVEEFHQWKAKEERLASNVLKAFHMSLIDGIGVLEVFENTQTRKVQDRKTVQVQRDPLTGAPMLSQNGEPLPATDDLGRLIEAESDDPNGVIELLVDEDQRIRSGPAYKVIPFRDFYMLPGHAHDRDEVYAYAKRFYRRRSELVERAKAGFYKRSVVDEMTSHGERQNEQEESLDRAGITISEQEGDRAEKELWEVLVLKDFGEGERWYLATIHLRDQKLLRLQKDDLNSKRFVIFAPLPRPDSVYGYSLIGDKLGTIIEEHTAWRNMHADKGAMSLMGPIKRLLGAHWHPDEQPLGPKAVIDVRDMRELEPMQLPDLPRGSREREQETKEAAERIAGVNDIALGVNPSADRTLGEVQMVASQSAIRIEMMQRNLMEAMEDLFHIRHKIWVRTLSELDARNEPIKLPSSVLTGLENRGYSTPNDGIITSAVLEGAFQGKPHGSVETADPAIVRQDFVQMMQMLPALMQTNPQIAQAFSTPDAARALVNEFARVFRIENRQPFFLGLNQPPAQNVLPFPQEAPVGSA